MPDAAVSEDINCRSCDYFIARTVEPCRLCGKSTPLWALAVPANHETLEPGEDRDSLAEAEAEAGTEAGAADTWQEAPRSAFLIFIAYLPAAVHTRLSRLSAGCYRYEALEACWTNHCEHCGCSLGDHELLCEPEGAFLPTSEASARRIELLRIAEPFAAAAGGYALDPQFFDCMRST